MSELQKEQISVFLDGETDSEEVILALNQDAELLRTWGRYNLISACMKKQCPDYVDTQLAERISSSIAAEPTVLAPSKKAFPPALKPLAGLAIAASVATIAVLGVQQHRADDTFGLSNEPVAASNIVKPAVRQQIQTVSTEQNTSQLARDEADPRMNSYLVNHNEYRTHAGMQGMLPYARVVTHQKDK